MKDWRYRRTRLVRSRHVGKQCCRYHFGSRMLSVVGRQTWIDGPSCRPQADEEERDLMPPPPPFHLSNAELEELGNEMEARMDNLRYAIIEQLHVLGRAALLSRMRPPRGNRRLRRK
jgi:hypothetical protein